MENLKITPDEIKAAKGQGFLFNKDKQHFSGRIITQNGVVSSEQMMLVSEAAKKFGNGHVALTTRLTLEVTGIDYENIEAFKEFLKKGGMVTGGTGTKVRPVVACKGTVCVFGLCDTQGVATKIHERFYEGYRDVVLPHKFKIAVGGCPNNCVKPDLNDIGLVGQRSTVVDKELCKSCKKCAVELKCPMKAIRSVDGNMVYDRTICNNCSRCIGHCPFHAVTPNQQGYRIYVGGRWGKQVRRGDMLSGIFTEEQALNIVEKSMLLFKEKGKPGERFASMIERIGFEQIQSELLCDELFNRKEQILQG